MCARAAEGAPPPILGRTERTDIKGPSLVVDGKLADVFNGEFVGIRMGVVGAVVVMKGHDSALRSVGVVVAGGVTLIA